jgi:hypothetical protein
MTGFTLHSGVEASGILRTVTAFTEAGGMATVTFIGHFFAFEELGGFSVSGFSPFVVDFTFSLSAVTHFTGFSSDISVVGATD